MDEFYLTLSSQSNDFTYTLPDTILLDGGEWFVSLIDFTAPEMYNVTENSIVALLKGGRIIRYSLPPRHYANFTQFKMGLQRIGAPFTIAQDKVTLKNVVDRITFSGSIAHILGVEDEAVMNQRTITEQLNFDLHRSIKTVFVECNFIQSQVVNESRRPVLASFGRYPRGENRRVIRNELRQLKFQIRDQNGDLIQFSPGNILLTLHFKYGIR